MVRMRACGPTWDDDGGDGRIHPRIRCDGRDVTQLDELRSIAGVDRQGRHTFIEAVQHKRRVRRSARLATAKVCGCSARAPLCIALVCCHWRWGCCRGSSVQLAAFLYCTTGCVAPFWVSADHPYSDTSLPSTHKRRDPQQLSTYWGRNRTRDRKYSPSLDSTTALLPVPHCSWRDDVQLVTSSSTSPSRFSYVVTVRERAMPTSLLELPLRALPPVLSSTHHPNLQHTLASCTTDRWPLACSQGPSPRLHGNAEFQSTRNGRASSRS